MNLKNFSMLSILLISILIAGCVGTEKDIVKSGDLPGFTKSVMVNNSSEKIVAYSKNGDAYIITQMKIKNTEDGLTKIANFMIDHDTENYSIKNVDVEKIGEYSLATSKVNSLGNTIDSAVIFIKNKNLVKVVSLNGENSLNDSVKLAKLIENRI